MAGCTPETPQLASPAKYLAGLEDGYVPETVKEEHSGEERAEDAVDVLVAFLTNAVPNLQPPNPETPQLVYITSQVSRWTGL